MNRHTGIGLETKAYGSPLDLEDDDFQIAIDGVGLADND